MTQTSGHKLLVNKYHRFTAETDPEGPYSTMIILKSVKEEEGCPGKMLIFMRSSNEELRNQ